MKFLDDLIHKTIKPYFDKGGKFEKFYYAFEAGESFNFVTDKRTDRGSHVRDSVDLKRMMVTVILALIPCFLFGAWNVGYQQLTAFDPSSSPGVVDCFVQGLGKVLPMMIVANLVHCS